MVFQVLINYNDKRNKPLQVADSLEEFNNTTVLQLKERFRENFPGAADPNNLRVIFGKEQLEDEKTLAFYRIKHLSVLFIVIRGGGPDKEEYTVLINFNDMKNKPFDVADSLEEFNNTTIRELKERFREKIPGAADPNNLRVIFGKEQLEDEKTLAFYRIKHLSVLIFVIRGGGPDKEEYTVLINFNDKRNEPLDVADSSEEFNNTTIRELKRKYISSHPGAPEGPDDWRVLFGRDLLEDQRTLGSYRVKHLSVIRFELKMPAGGGLPPPDEIIPRSDSMERLLISM